MRDVPGGGGSGRRPDQLGALRLEADTRAGSSLKARGRRGLGPDNPKMIQSLNLAHLRDEGVRARRRPSAGLAAGRTLRAGIAGRGLLDDFATNQSDLGREAAAIALSRQALAIREATLGAEALGVASSLQTLGLRLDGAGAYAESVAALERALAIRRKALGSDHPLVAATQIDLAGVYDDEGRHGAAEEAAQTALDVLRRALPGDHPKVGEALNMSHHPLRRGATRGARRFPGALIAIGASRGRHPGARRQALSFTLLHTSRPEEARSCEI